MRQEDLDRAVTEIVVGLIRQLAAQVDRELPAILAGHFSVESAHWGSERNIMVGRDVTVPLSALTDPVWDYVALGHIHQHQSLNLTSDPPVVYSGSLERVDFGEEKHPKGFCWVEVERGKATWRFIEAPARPFRTIRVDVRSEPEPLEAIQEAVARHDLTAAVVRLVVEMSPEQEPQLRDGMLSPLLTEAFFAQINREVERSARDRLEGLEPESLTPEHLLERYLNAKGKSEPEIAAYQEEARTIFGED
jgi:exonuclease SbcD